MHEKVLLEKDKCKVTILLSQAVSSSMLLPKNQRFLKEENKN
jgi:hypothetical protein